MKKENLYKSSLKEVQFIIKCILSSKTNEQIQSCSNMISNFRDIWFKRSKQYEMNNGIMVMEDVFYMHGALQLRSLQINKNKNE